MPNSRIMLRTRWMVLSGVGAAGLVVWGWLLYSQPEGRSISYDQSRTLQYSFTLTNDEPAIVEKERFLVYVPVAESSTQRIVGIDASHDYQILVDDTGNQALEFEVTDVAPFESRVIRVRAEVETASQSNPWPLAHPEAFLRAERYVETDAPELQELAKRFGRDTPEATAEAIYRWVSRNVASERYYEDARGALWAAQNGKGDCTEFAYLFVALARLQGIPARAVGGYALERASVVGPVGYHNWAEVYFDGAWHIVDPQERVFKDAQADYVALRIILPEDESLLGSAHRYLQEGDDLVVRMN